MTSRQWVHWWVALALAWRGAHESSIRENDWRGRRVGNLNFGYGHGDLDAIDVEFDLAEMKRVADQELALLDGFAVDEGAVGGITIPQEDSVVGQFHLAMAGRHGGVFNLKIVVLRAAKSIDTQSEFNHLVGRPIMFQQQSSHRLLAILTFLI